MNSFILFGILLIASHVFTAYVAWHEGYGQGWWDRNTSRTIEYFDKIRQDAQKLSK